MDLEVVLASGAQPDVFEVEVSSSAGHASGELRLDIDGLVARRSELQSTVLASAVSTRRTIETTEIPVRNVGEELFSALFRGAVYGRYTASIATARARGESLRLVLHIRAPELAPLPWEMLYDPEAGEYVCQREPLVRHVEVAAPVPPMSVTPPLRVLGVVASPADLAQLDVAGEQARLMAALSGSIARSDIEVAWATGGQWFDIQTALLGGPWHILHFIGHGGYDDAHGEGVLALVGQRGEADFVGAERFARLMRTVSPSPRLVVLNSCSSGEAGVGDLFSSTAASLVRSGVAAVVAMQFAVSDAAAAVFSGGFYSAIAHNRSVGEAVRVGRIAIDGISPHTLEWVTPVVYLRGGDVPLFTVESQHRPDRERPTGRPTEGDRQSERLDTLYLQALAELRLGHDDNALALFDSIVALNADYRDAAVRRDDLRRAGRVADAYDDARSAETEGRFDEAIRAYEIVLEIDTEYRDARARVDVCRTQQRILDLIGEIQVHAELGDDQAVVLAAEELIGLDPDFDDPDGLVATARQHLVEQKLEEEYASRYDMASRAETAGDWDGAITAYSALANDRPGYRDTELRFRICRDKRDIEQLQDRVRQLSAEHEWEEMVMLGGDLADIDPEAADPDGLITAAEEQLLESERIETLCRSRYDDAIAAERNEDWGRAIDAYEDIVAVRPEHRDSRERLEACRRRLDEATALQLVQQRRAEEQLAQAFDRGLALQSSGEWANAVVAFDDVLALQPDHTDATRRRAACQRRLERQQARADAKHDDRRRMVDDDRTSVDWAPATAVDAGQPVATEAGPTRPRRPSTPVLVLAVVAAIVLVGVGLIALLSGSGDSQQSSPDRAEASLNIGIREPSGVTIDGSGALYITEGNRVWRFEARGDRQLLGTGVADFGGDGGPASRASFNMPQGIAVSGDRVYIADSGNRRVRMIGGDGMIATIAGTGEPGFGGDGGPATAANLGPPLDVAVDQSGNVYISDRANNRIRRVDTDGIITKIAGAVVAIGGDGGAATDAAINGPFGIAVDGSGNVLITEHNGNRVRKIDADGIITTLAGTGEIDFRGDGGPATEAALDHPHGVAVDDSGNVYIADTNNHRIRKIDTDGIITTIAGTGTPGTGGDGGPAREAELNLPRSIAVDSVGTLYIADWGNNRIRMIDTDMVISTVVM